MLLTAELEEVLLPKGLGDSWVFIELGCLLVGFFLRVFLLGVLLKLLNRVFFSRDFSAFGVILVHLSHVWGLQILGFADSSKKKKPIPTVD